MINLEKIKWEKYQPPPPLSRRSWMEILGLFQGYRGNEKKNLVSSTVGSKVFHDNSSLIFGWKYTMVLEFVYTAYTRTESYSYIYYLGICCICMYIKYCLRKYAGQNTYNIVRAYSMLPSVYFPANV